MPNSNPNRNPNAKLLLTLTVQARWADEKAVLEARLAVEVRIGHPD